MPQELAIRDIHLPAEFAAWWPAPGWWISGLLIVLICFGLYKLYSRLTRKTVLKQARKIMRSINESQHLSELEKIQQLSSLLKRVAISHHPREQVAGLHGVKWLAFLNQSVSGEPFSGDVGRCIVVAPFQQALPQSCDLTTVFQLCEQWLEAQK